MSEIFVNWTSHCKALNQLNLPSARSVKQGQNGRSMHNRANVSRQSASRQVNPIRLSYDLGKQYQ
jgi:hypothetical protein